jgi:hypothetical protein
MQAPLPPGECKPVDARTDKPTPVYNWCVGMFCLIVFGGIAALAMQDATVLVVALLSWIALQLERLIATLREQQIRFDASNKNDKIGE